MIKGAKIKNQEKYQIFILSNNEKQMVPCRSTAKGILFELSHYRILLTDLKVKLH